MQSRGSSNKLSSMIARTRISSLLLSMFATFASIYVAGRLWQDAQTRVRLIKELDRITGYGKSAISVDDTLKIIACREQRKKLLELEMQLAAAGQEGFKSKGSTDTDDKDPKKRPLVVIGAALKKRENEKGIITRFVIGRSANRGDSLDQDIDSENKQTNDFFILDHHVEAPKEFPNKAKLFFAYAVDKWDAEYYAKVNDDVYVNIEAINGMNQIGGSLAIRNFSASNRYFRHASGEMYVISRAPAKFISINRSILRTYAHDDVSAGSWFLGLDVKYLNEGKFCCSSWSSGAICAGV
ncbi:Hydroxyproline O-galactosyltransferase HPGT1 [Citrus sinensis]|uniref:Hydroxyproline O-galactosyltransferase HPGT1 n=1 Tax=Citrus sinensis TaxID=2711 RepID=A0ACB8HRI5_CITSI|nr:Hydroxyproline O-galactosyltransferase HPGT1 [Citrus sinensis]